MSKYLSWWLAMIFLFAKSAFGQQSEHEQQLQKEMTELKARMAHVEALFEELKSQKTAVETVAVSTPLISTQTKSGGKKSKQAPALNTPPMLPLLPEAYAKSPPQFDIFMQARGDVFADKLKNDTFFLRKAEIGIKGHVAPYVDFSLEFETTRPADPLRRTYIRLTHVSWLHLKLGLEKAPIGLEELTSTAQIPFVERSEVNDRFAAAEELGVHFESHWPHTLFQLSVTNGGRLLLRDNNAHKDVSARIVWGPCHWLSFGVATLQGRIGSNELERDRYNVEFKLGSNLSGFQSEFYRAQDGNLWSSAYYLASYRTFTMSRAWLTHLQPVIRYEQINRNDGNKFEELRLLTLGLSLMLDEHRSKFQINFSKDLHTATRRDQIRAQYQAEF